MIALEGFVNVLQLYQLLTQLDLKDQKENLDQEKVKQKDQN